MHTQEKWMYNENFNWKTHPFSISARKRGVHSAVIANIPVRATIPPQEQMANARLIAAAPDLLSALQDMLLCCYDEELDDQTIKAVEAARTAIAKATRPKIREIK
jgi:hypothetical protein